jgi:cytochrome c oxidase assembly factor CtaG
VTFPGDGIWIFTLDPFQIVPIAFFAALYARRCAVLAGKGRPVWWPRQLAFYSGLGLVLLALVSPIDYIGETRLFFVHMTQHILLGDIAPLLVVLGLTGPILRPALALPLVMRLRVLANPLVALPLWILNLVVWHVPALYQAALAHSVVHALEHVSFFTFGALMWAALVEPLPGPAWFGTGAKIVYVALIRLSAGVLANVFIWSGTVFYSDYARDERLWGLSPLADQSIAGTVMMVEGSIVTLLAFGWEFMRWMREGEIRQRLEEQGVDPRTAARAARYGRVEQLAADVRRQT